MERVTIDLRKEQQATLDRPRYRYSLAARFFFLSMDMLTGRKTTLAKSKLLEILASIPYREWEFRQYKRLTGRYKDREFVKHAGTVVAWGREAQDNEYWHLLLINEKMKEDGIKDPWYLSPPVTFCIVLSYVVFAWTMALFNIRRAYLFNVEFEDHAEHVYAQFVKDNPAWENQPVTSALVKEYGDYATWADVFRRIGLDERDHMNSSFTLCGKPELVVNYEGMPKIHI